HDGDPDRFFRGSDVVVAGAADSRIRPGTAVSACGDDIRDWWLAWRIDVDRATRCRCGTQPTGGSVVAWCRWFVWLSRALLHGDPSRTACGSRFDQLSLAAVDRAVLGIAAERAPAPSPRHRRADWGCGDGDFDHRRWRCGICC